MKLFLCSLDKGDDVFLGIPSSCTAEIISVRRSQTKPLEIAAPGAEDPSGQSAETGEIYVSLPVLFEKPGIPTPHGIVLKARSPRTVLLVPSIDTDEEIPEGEVQALPELLGERLPFIGGAFFTGTRLIFILSPVVLLKTIDSLFQGAIHD